MGEQVVPAAAPDDLSKYEPLPHAGRIFLDEGLVGDSTQQCRTDTVLLHRQMLSDSRVFTASSLVVLVIAIGLSGVRSGDTPSRNWRCPRGIQRRKDSEY